MKIKSLVAKNLKLFNDEFNLIKDTSDMELILLNGPNGYGKSSVFDAIEFALTGEIKRINNYNRDLGIKKQKHFILKY